MLTFHLSVGTKGSPATISIHTATAASSSYFVITRIGLPSDATGGTASSAATAGATSTDAATAGCAAEAATTAASTAGSRLILSKIQKEVTAT